MTNIETIAIAMVFDLSADDKAYRHTGDETDETTSQRAINDFTARDILRGDRNIVPLQFDQVYAHLQILRTVR